MKVGDVPVDRQLDGQWSIAKIMVIDTWPDGNQLFHCMFYKPTAERPGPRALESLEIPVMHAPMAEKAYQGWESLCSSQVLDSRLEGFHEYLKLTDFRATWTSQGEM